jgi:hypothetical protein
MASYECAGDVFSIAELEHNILRARMPRPRGALLRFVLPTSRYGVTLEEADYRLTFALNCGSVSLPPSAPVFFRVSRLRYMCRRVAFAHGLNVVSRSRWIGSWTM